MTSLRNLLKSSNSDYYSRFEHIESKVTSTISNLRIIFPKYTNHDFKHQNIVTIYEFIKTIENDIL